MQKDTHAYRYMQARTYVVVAQNCGLSHSNTSAILGTIFVYGQTSSGKTHTMQGPSIDHPELKGACTHAYARAHTCTYTACTRTQLLPPPRPQYVFPCPIS